METELDRLARSTGIPPDKLQSLLRSPLFRALSERATKDRRREFRASFEELQPLAFTVYREAMEQQDDLGSRLRAADAVSDRNIPRKTLAETDPVVHIHIDARERDLLEQTAREIGKPIEVIALPPPEKLKTVEEVLAALPD